MQAPQFIKLGEDILNLSHLISIDFLTSSTGLLKAHVITTNQWSPRVGEVEPNALMFEGKFAEALALYFDPTFAAPPSFVVDITDLSEMRAEREAEAERKLYKFWREYKPSVAVEDLAQMEQPQQNAAHPAAGAAKKSLQQFITVKPVAVDRHVDRIEMLQATLSVLSENLKNERKFYLHQEQTLQFILGELSEANWELASAVGYLKRVDAQRVLDAQEQKEGKDT